MTSRRFVLAAVVLLPLAFPQKASSVGSFEDVGSFSSFLRAPRTRSLESRATRTDAATHDAAVFAVSARFPLASNLLFQPEVAYVSLVSEAANENGLGDARLRVRVDLFSRGGMTLSIVSRLRAGNAANTLFPYATGSVDIEGGLAIVDTLADFTFWAAGTGTKVTRLAETLKLAKSYGDHAAAALGLVVPVGGLGAWQVGAAAYFFSGAVREVYFTELDIRLARPVDLMLLGQAEGGERNERAGDFAVGVGLRVLY